MSLHVKEVSGSSFTEEVEQCELPVLIDFWAPWCGPCTTISPVVEELAKDFDGKVKVVKVNVDENPELASKFNVRGIPNFVFLKSGSSVNQIVGAVEKDQLKEALDGLVA